METILMENEQNKAKVQNKTEETNKGRLN